MFNPEFDVEDVAKVILYAAATARRTRLTEKELNELLDPLFKEEEMRYMAFSPDEWSVLKDRRKLWNQVRLFRDLAEGTESASTITYFFFNWEKIFDLHWSLQEPPNNSQVRFYIHALTFFGAVPKREPQT